MKRAAIFCGDRNWKAPEPIRVALDALPRDHTAIISGGAEGADKLSMYLARQMGFRGVEISAPWKAYGKRAGPMRNGWMLDLLLMFRDQGAEIDVHAFHDNIAASKGTAEMLGRCRVVGVKYTIHTSDLTVKT